MAVVSIQAKSHPPGMRPETFIGGDRPGQCLCSWAATSRDGRDVMYLKYYNALCPLLRQHKSVT